MPEFKGTKDKEGNYVGKISHKGKDFEITKSKSHALHEKMEGKKGEKKEHYKSVTTNKEAHEAGYKKNSSGRFDKE